MTVASSVAIRLAWLATELIVPSILVLRSRKKRQALQLNDIKYLIALFLLVSLQA